MLKDRLNWVLRGLLTGLLLVLGCGLVVFPMIIQRMPISDMNPDMNQKTDGIVVFTGELEREKVGWRLYRQGMAKKLHISGRYLGCPKLVYPPNITIDFATTTKTNVLLTRRWIQANGLRSVRLVTSDYHMPRSWLLARHFWKGVTVVPHPVPINMSHCAHPMFKLFSEYIRYLGAIILCTAHSLHTIGWKNGCNGVQRSDAWIPLVPWLHSGKKMV